MPAIQTEKLSRASVLKRQLLVCAGFALLSAVIVSSLYLQSRRREWTLRSEQAKHRLDVAFELISRELDRVRADALFLADQQQVRLFAEGDRSQREQLEVGYASFLRRKQTYDQIRLLDLTGHESIRVNYAGDRATSVVMSELQDKSDRYYFREALALKAGDVFVSEFDLNLEHGQIENPLKPVIRFVTPVVDDVGIPKSFLVLNYLGARLLKELDDSTLPGFTMLLRDDGSFLRSPNTKDEWGWVLGHDRSFATQFPQQWKRIESITDCELTPRGALATKRILLGKPTQSPAGQRLSGNPRDSIIVVSLLPRNEVFAASNALLMKLLLLTGCVFVPLAIFARYWAQATLSRQIQARQIAVSEERLRELSSRLLRIQEDERRAISREIHDELGQQVTAINLDLKLADRNIETGKAKPHLERAIRENEGLLQTMHAFATRVRPAVLDDLGLRDAVESHLWEFRERTNIEVDANLGFESDQVPHEVADNAYRLLQESLNNVAKHADASNVWISMLVEKNGEEHLRLEIRDDGRGYGGSEHNGQRLGLVGMRERVDLLDGELRMKSDIDKGTIIDIRLPLRDRLVRAAEQQA